MNQMMRQAQALQRKMGKIREELAAEEVSGSAGGGTVTAVATGTGELKRVAIDPAAVDPGDVEMLQDLVTAAVNEVLRAAKDLEDDRMGALGSGMGLPPGMF